MPTRYVSRLLLAANIAVALLAALAASGDSLAFAAGLTPLRLTLALGGGAPLLPALASLFTHMFLHGGIAHLAFNMLILAALGDRLEAVYGPARMAALYLLAGLVAALAQWGWAPQSAIPMIGASGAISGLIGAQALLAGRSGRGPLGRAAALLLAWTLIQLLTALVMPELNLAVPAHVGGFLGGLLLARPLLPAPVRAR